MKTLIKNLENHGFIVDYFENESDAVGFILGLYKGKTIGFGGSVTLSQLNLLEQLSKENTVISHWVDNSRDTLLKAAHTDIFLTSCNGISENGEIINIDGCGNRVASTLFGHQEVVYIIGKNKVEPTFEKALYRARNVAAPLNARRLKRDTPCAKSAEIKCFDCNSPERICRGFVTVTHPLTSAVKTRVILIDKELGL